MLLKREKAQLTSYENKHDLTKRVEETKRIQRVIAEYDIGTYVDHGDVGGGYRNKGYWVKTAHGEYFLKIILEYSNCIDELAFFEMKINHTINDKTHKRGYGFRVPHLYATKHGKPFVKIKKQAFVLYEFVKGDFASWGESTGHRLKPTATMLAELHSILSEYNDEIPQFRIGGDNAYHDLVKKIEKFKILRKECEQKPFTKRTAVEKKFLSHADSFIEKLAQLKSLFPPEAYAALPKQLVHMDLAPIHLLYRINKPILIIDWEMARLDTRAVDFVKGITNFNDKEGYEEFIDFIAYYQQKATSSENPLDEMTLAAIPYIHVLHRVQLAAEHILTTDLSYDINLDWAIDQMKTFTELMNINFEDFSRRIFRRIKEIRSTPLRSIRSKSRESENILERMVIGATGSSNRDSSPIKATLEDKSLTMSLKLLKGDFNFTEIKTYGYIDVDGYSKLKIMLKIHMVDEGTIVNQRASLKIGMKFQNRTVYITRTPDIKEKMLVIDIPHDLDKIDTISFVAEYAQSTIRSMSVDVTNITFQP
ncbi:MAG: phosphotransferase [Candidatus Omnitrophica bacterium]|nr:phosphotransferase [Candidatus Omnitrophota bacterium]